MLFRSGQEFLKEIKPGSDEICLILGNRGEIQPPPRVAISHQVFPSIPPVFRDKGSFLENAEDMETEPTIPCGTIIACRRKSIDIQQGRLGTLRELDLKGAEI